MERAELNAVLREAGCAEQHGGFTFLRDPSWSADERRAAKEQMAQADAAGAPVAEGWLCIRTGGSGGGFKFARHDERTFSAAVAGFARHFGLERVNALGVLPPWHVSGLMARVRSAATGGKHVDCDWKALAGGELPTVGREEDWVISLVPTQLQRLLSAAKTTQWLEQFRIIFLGGGPVWPELAEVATRTGLRISLSYGMTETAAMVTAQRPEEFLAGDRSAGFPLPHAGVDTDAEGRIRVAGDALFRGYFPDKLTTRELVTEDLGRLDESGRLHLLGRRDAVIITGGKKVQPAEVEAALRATGEFDDVVVLGLPDREWGSVVVACYPAGQRTPDVGKAAARLAPYQRPKRFVAMTHWPRNAQGKINRAAVVDWLENQAGE